MINPIIEPLAHGLTIANYPSAIPLKKGLSIFQILEPPLGFLEYRIGPLKYLAQNQLAQRESAVMADHAKFSKHASLIKLLYPTQAQTSLRFW